MKAVCTSDWPYFALGKKARHRQRTKELLKARRIVARRREKAASAAVAGEDERSCGVLFCLTCKQSLKIFMGRVRVTNMKLHRLPSAYQVTNRYYASFGISTNHIANQKVSWLKVILVLTCHSANM